MQVKIFDFEHEKDLEEAINGFVKGKSIIDIKYSNAHFFDGRDQIYSFPALIMYEE